MMLRRYILTIGAVLLIAFAATTPATKAAETTPSFDLIDDISLVCMVNDRFMGVVQIPVEVEGKTYYGCCAGCVERIKKNETIRYGTDPVTGSKVDKARAYAVKDNIGKVLYFESEATFNQYTPEPKEDATETN